MADTGKRKHQSDEAAENKPAAATDAPPQADFETSLEAARRESQENFDQLLRARAELDNYRKRTQKEVQEIRQFQSAPLIRDLLPVLDNLGRALDAAAGADAVDALVQGVEMVRQQLHDALARHSITPIESLGRPFDPNLHEAVQQLPSAEHPPMTVIEEIERGYKLHDRVVRPSKVIVSSGPPEPPAE